MLNIAESNEENSGERCDHRRPIAIDLFSGVGGLSLGFEQAGFDVVASVEYDPVHAAVHEFNFPLTKVVCDDVAKIDAARLIEAAKAGFIAHGRDESEWTGTIDCIFGGPPCQGFSTIGKRDIGDDRNRLVYKFADLIGTIRPKYFVMENVPGMAAGSHTSILTRLIARLKRHNYNVAVTVEQVHKRAILNAADYGVPQDRRRLILLGARDEMPLPLYPTPTVKRVPKRSGETKKTAMHPFDFLPKGPSVGEAILDLPDLDKFEALFDTDEIRLNKTQLKIMSGKMSEYAKRLRGVNEDPEDFSHPRRWNPEMLTSSMRTEHTSESIRRFKKTAQGDTEDISRFYRLDEQGLSNTLRAGTGSERGAYTSPRPLHPTLPRVISVREAARIHSFPDWFRLHRTKWHGFRSIGNAVPPLFGRSIARTIVRALGIDPIKPTEPISLGDSSLLALDRLGAARHFGANVKKIPKSRKRLVKT
ncbi:MAG: DNA cytosine methyltransferase [Vulcanimicrobiaceae bacterium]